MPGPLDDQRHGALGAVEPLHHVRALGGLPEDNEDNVEDLSKIWGEHLDGKIWTIDGRSTTMGEKCGKICVKHVNLGADVLNMLQKEWI